MMCVDGNTSLKRRTGTRIFPYKNSAAASLTKYVQKVAHDFKIEKS
jgi:hypothetical protein